MNPYTPEQQKQIEEDLDGEGIDFSGPAMFMLLTVLLCFVFLSVAVTPFVILFLYM